MSKPEDKFKGLATFVILGTFAIIGFRYCGNDPKPTETAADFYAGKHFKVKIIAPKAERDSVISMALQVRLKYPDKESGTISFYERAEDTLTAYSAWANAEYFYPANPEKENAVDGYGNTIEVKLE